MLSATDGLRSQLAFSAVRMIDRSSRDITEEDWFASRLSHSQRSAGAMPSVGFALLRENVAISTGNLIFRRSLLSRPKWVMAAVRLAPSPTGSAGAVPVLRSSGCLGVELHGPSRSDVEAG